LPPSTLYPMHDDRPIAHLEDDRLGFAPIAEQLAAAIADLPAAQGFVFGIEGQWGSGKSTLINLTIDALGRLERNSPEIVTFAPWLVGERSELLRSLFDELANAAGKIDPIDAAIADNANPLDDAHWRLRQKQKLKAQLSGKLKAFGSFAGSLGKIARVADAVGVPLAGVVADTAERTGEATSRLLEAPSIAKEKVGLVDALKLLSRPIAVFIDDLDRLEPRDVSEVLRLVRAVADFPNVIYILSYDPKVVAKTLTKAIEVEDGEAYLEKMVQVACTRFG
jgi:predicted KAP-like P-loop ATPase